MPPERRAVRPSKRPRDAETVDITVPPIVDVVDIAVLASHTRVNALGWMASVNIFVPRVKAFDLNAISIVRSTALFDDGPSDPIDDDGDNDGRCEKDEGSGACDDDDGCRRRRRRWIDLELESHSSRVNFKSGSSWIYLRRLTTDVRRAMTIDSMTTRCTDFGFDLCVSSSASRRNFAMSWKSEGWIRAG